MQWHSPRYHSECLTKNNFRDFSKVGGNQSFLTNPPYLRALLTQPLIISSYFENSQSKSIHFI